MSYVSSARKRQRLSSPDYEVGSWVPDDDAIQEINRIELTLSQLIRNQQPSSQSMRDAEEAKRRRRAAIMEALGEGPEDNDDEEDDQLASQALPSTNEKRKWEDEADCDPQLEPHETTFGFIPAKAVAVEAKEPTPSPEEESATEQDYSKFFESTDVAVLPGFLKLSKAVLDISEPPDSSSTFAPAGKTQALPGFASAASGTQASAWLEPSKDALELAARKMQDWCKEDEEPQQPAADDLVDTVPIPPIVQTPSNRPALAPVSNSPNLKPLSFSRPDTPETPKEKERSHGFKSPLMGTSSRTLYPRGTSPGVQNMPLHYPGASRDPAYIAKVGRVPHPLSSTPITADPKPSPTTPGPSRQTSNTSFSTPVRPISALGTPGSAKSRRYAKSSFTTPFKPGMRPGEPGRAALQRQKPFLSPKMDIANSQKSKVVNKRISLKDSGLRPQQYSIDELQDIGLDASGLSRINPRTAPYYTFFKPNPETSFVRFQSDTFLRLGPQAVLLHFLQKGYKHASQEWVTNAYTLTLWKLAGLALLEPHRENTPERRWCWEEVLRQLEAKYKREIEEGVRPPLRVIASGDKTPEAPMVLLVTDIFQGISRPGIPASKDRIELEVSDGWYRLRAQIDGPLTRAVQRGKIRVGRKIAIEGSKIISPKKEAMEVLEAYNTLSFQLRGNGTQLAPWHAKLGFQEFPYVSTLNSLTADGGFVVLMDFIVEKVHPIAFQEIFVDTNGNRRAENPRCESDEAIESSRWKARRENEEEKLRDLLQSRWIKWDGLADRLETAAGSKYRPSGDDLSLDSAEDLFDYLDSLPASGVGTFIHRLEPKEAGPLAKFIRSKIERNKEQAMEEIEDELKTICPPRDVRSFREVVVRDTQTLRRPGNRRALLTIWDIMNFQLAEGAKPGAIEAGHRFLVTNLVPNQLRSWMGTQEGSQVFLSTTRHSRISRIK